MGVFNPTTGKKTVVGLGLTKRILNQPQGALRYVKADSFDVVTDFKWVMSKRISGGYGMQPGSPGAITTTGKPKFDLTGWLLAIGMSGLFGAPTITVLSASTAWLLQFAPRDLTDAQLRAIWAVAYFGTAAVGGVEPFGIVPSGVNMTFDANTRLGLEIDCVDSLGFTQSDSAIPKSGNSGTYAGLITTRGLRPQDTPYGLGKSLFLKVPTGGGTHADHVDFVTKYDIPGFAGVASYGTAVTTVEPFSDANGTDGFSTILDASGNPIGVFGPDNNPYQVSIQPDTISTDYSTFADGDIFEIPIAIAKPSATYVADTIFSDFHAKFTVGTRNVTPNKASVAVTYGAKSRETSGQRYPESILRTGDVGLKLTYDDVLYDNFLRDIIQSNSTEPVYIIAQNQAPIASTAYHEGVEIYAPQARLTSLKERQITSPDTMLSNATFEAEEPTSAVPGPGDDLPGSHAVEVNITLSEDPTTYF